METTIDNAQGMEGNIQPTASEPIAANTGETVADASGAPASAAANANAVPSVFTPNFKFKAGDVEGEIDEIVRPIIKDADTEKKIKDLYTKAHGLDALKSRLTGEVESWKTRHTESATKYSALSESLANLSGYVNRGDFDSFFSSLKIPQQAIYKWVNSKIEEQNMSPDQQAMLQRQREESNRLHIMEKENQRLLQQQEQFQMERNSSILDQTLSSPEISSIAREFDTRVGTPGAFRTEVLKRGVALYNIHGRDLSPSEVVADLMGTLGKVFQPQGQATQTLPVGNQPTPSAPATKPPVIPNIQGKTASPVKSAPRSIKELREKANSFA